MFDRFKRKKTPEQLVSLAIEHISTITEIINERPLDLQHLQPEIRTIDDSGPDDKAGNVEGKSKDKTTLFSSQSSFSSFTDENETRSSFHADLGPSEKEISKGEDAKQSRNGEKKNSKFGLGQPSLPASLSSIFSSTRTDKEKENSTRDKAVDGGNIRSSFFSFGANNGLNLNDQIDDREMEGPQRLSESTGNEILVSQHQTKDGEIYSEEREIKNDDGVDKLNKNMNSVNEDLDVLSGSRTKIASDDKKQADSGSSESTSISLDTSIGSQTIEQPQSNPTFNQEGQQEDVSALSDVAKFKRACYGPRGEELIQASEKLAKRLLAMKYILYGDGEKTDGKSLEKEKEKSNRLRDDLGQCLINQKLMPQLMDRFAILPFESKKDVAQIFNYLCRHNVSGFVDPYLAKDPAYQIVDKLVEGYGSPETTINFGSMLREAVRYEKVASRLLFSESLWLFFDYYVHLPNFDVASDSFATLRDLLMRHKGISAKFLTQNHEKVFNKYKQLLASDNYYTRRASLKLLGELLLDRSHFNTMMRYISSKENLKDIMLLLRDTSEAIQFEAFHVFKVFVANPKKPPEITRILSNNKGKLIAYLENFQNDKDNEQFREEKNLLINTLKKIEALNMENSGTSTPVMLSQSSTPREKAPQVTPQERNIHMKQMEEVQKKLQQHERKQHAKLQTRSESLSSSSSTNSMNSVRGSIEIPPTPAPTLNKQSGTDLRYPPIP